MARRSSGSHGPAPSKSAPSRTTLTPNMASGTPVSPQSQARRPGNGQQSGVVRASNPITMPSASPSVLARIKQAAASGAAMIPAMMPNGSTAMVPHGFRTRKKKGKGLSARDIKGFLTVHKFAALLTKVEHVKHKAKAPRKHHKTGF